MILFLVEKGQFVVLSKDEVEISFGSLEEYKEYSGIDLTGKNYVCYQPDDLFEIDDSQELKTISANFKKIILSELDRISEYQTNRANPYFGKDSDECIAIKQVICKQELLGTLYSQYPTETYDAFQATALFTTKDVVREKIKEIYDWIDTIRDHYYQKRNEIAIDFDTTWDFTQFTCPTITLKEIKELDKE